jgi:aminopeptidase
MPMFWSILPWAEARGLKVVRRCTSLFPESAKPLLAPLERAIYKAGGNLILRYTPDNTDRFGMGRDFFELANQKQASYFPEKYIRGLVDEADHVAVIIAETDMHALEGIDSRKIQQHGLAYKPYMDWRSEKEYEGKLTWTVALYGTEAMAKEAGLNLNEYWQQIIQACFLDSKNPISEWKKTQKQIEQTKNKLNKLKIEKVNILGPDVDLWITIGDNRQWLGGGGRNIPSFEIFTSPDWRGTEGWIRFNQPLYRNGMLIDGIELTFKKGKVVKAKAKKNEKALKDMIATKNADKLGEFSMTDRRFSRITRFMAETLFDENIGGKNGNTHVALGASYRDCVAGDVRKYKPKDFDKLGFNDSSVHTDIISTSPRTVTAYLKNGTERIIYKNGEFTI